MLSGSPVPPLFLVLFNSAPFVFLLAFIFNSRPSLSVIISTFPLSLFVAVGANSVLILIRDYPSPRYLMF